MNYADARAWLESLGEFHMEFGLDRVKTVLAHLGNPERCAPAIHIAGTNGKGMTCAFASAILRDAGKRVGLYTSPHLSRPNERIALAGRPVDDTGFASALTAVRIASEATKTPLTYFEAITCAAFHAFREAKVDAMVIEVGLGGRLDATNVLDPVISVITSISLDHTQLLGDTLEAIAAEKAGIVKPGRPVVLAEPSPALLQVVNARATPDAKVWVVREGEAPGWTEGEFGPRHVGQLHLPAGPTIDFQHELRLVVHGRAHALAAATAAAAVHLFDPLLDPGHIANGLGDAQWPGRSEVVIVSKDRGGRPSTVVFDGAHNPAAAASVDAWGLPSTESGAPFPRRVVLFAAMADKDRTGILRAFAADPPTHLVATSMGLARSASARTIAEEARAVFGDSASVEAVDEVDVALQRGLELAGGAGRLFVTGSLYLVGWARERLTGGPPDRIG